MILDFLMEYGGYIILTLIVIVLFLLYDKELYKVENLDNVIKSMKKSEKGLRQTIKFREDRIIQLEHEYLELETLIKHACNEHKFILYRGPDKDPITPVPSTREPTEEEIKKYGSWAMAIHKIRGMDHAET